MLTLAELISLVELPPPTSVRRAPGWRELEKSGGGVIEQVAFDDDSYLRVYANGYVVYQTLSGKTRFSISDVFEDYEYRPQVEVPGTVLVFENSCFEDLPWVIRVLMEAEDRQESNQVKSRTAMSSTTFDTTRDDYGAFGCDKEDPLAVMIKEELSEMLYQSFIKMTEYQQQVIEASILNDMKHWEIANEYNVTRQAITKAIKNGLRVFRESFEKYYNEEK